MKIPAKIMRTAIVETVIATEPARIDRLRRTLDLRRGRSTDGGSRSGREPMINPLEPQPDAPKDLPYTGGNALAFMGAGLILSVAAALLRRRF